MRYTSLCLLLLSGVSATALAATSCDETTYARLEYSVASSNLANLETTRTPEGGAYRKKVLKKLPDGRCEVESVDSFKTVYEPGHPDANAKGYVEYPDINTIEELNNLTRARDTLKTLKPDHHTSSQNHVEPEIDFD